MNRRWLSVLLATTYFSSAQPGLAQSLPQGGTVVGGDAAISSPDPATLTVDQGSDRAIINWSSFNIGDGFAVVFRQPDAGAVTLNRVTGGDPSSIMGSLTANGTVMLVNPDGILFGEHAQVDVGALVASTHDLLDANFMAGHYTFDQSGNPDASIVNLGTITASEGGYAALVAPGVRNEGIITARLGKVGLSSANRFTLDLYGDDLIKLAVDDEILSEVIDLSTGQPLRTHVDNQGTLSAEGGTVAMTGVTARRVVGQVINNDGVLEANSIGLKNGKIVLSAQTAETKVPQAPDQKVRVSGEIIAAGDDPGEYEGKVLITGELLRLAHANIDASGASGGGTVLVGGDYLGGKAPDELVALLGIERETSAMPTASTLYVDAESSIDVSGLVNGNGGKAVFWSDNSTYFAGTTQARGGRASGAGGFIEISGQEHLAFNGKVDSSSPLGSAGTVLFDPDIINIERHIDLIDTETVDGFLPSWYGHQVRPAGTGVMSYISPETINTLLRQNNVTFIAGANINSNPASVDNPNQININTVLSITEGDPRILQFLVGNYAEINVNANIDLRGSGVSLWMYGGGDAVGPIQSVIQGPGTIYLGDHGASIFYFDAFGSSTEPLLIALWLDREPGDPWCPLVSVCVDRLAPNVNIGVGDGLSDSALRVTVSEDLLSIYTPNRIVTPDVPDNDDPDQPSPPDDAPNATPEQLARRHAAELYVYQVSPAGGGASYVDQDGRLIVNGRSVAEDDLLKFELQKRRIVGSVDLATAIGGVVVGGLTSTQVAATSMAGAVAKFLFAPGWMQKLAVEGEPSRLSDVQKARARLVESMEFSERCIPRCN